MAVHFFSTCVMFLDFTAIWVVISVNASCLIDRFVVAFFVLTCFVSFGTTQMKLRATVTGAYAADRAASSTARSQVMRASRHNVGRQVGRRLARVITEWRHNHRRCGLNEIVLVLLFAFKKDLKLRGFLANAVNVPNHIQQLINDPVLTWTPSLIQLHSHLWFKTMVSRTARLKADGVRCNDRVTDR